MTEADVLGRGRGHVENKKLAVAVSDSPDTSRGHSVVTVRSDTVPPWR